MRGTCQRKEFSSACLSRAFQKLIEAGLVDTVVHTFDDAFINGCAPRDGGEGGRRPGSVCREQQGLIMSCVLLAFRWSIVNQLHFIGNFFLVGVE